MHHIVKLGVAAGLAGIWAVAAVADDAADVEAAIASWPQHFNAGDATAAAEAVFTETARLLPPDEAMVEGREAIAVYWQAVMDSPAHDLEVTPIEIDLLGDTAIETGRWTITVPTEDGGEARIGGNTLVVWKKGEDGAWRMQQDMWNNTP